MMEKTSEQRNITEGICVYVYVSRINFIHNSVL